MGLIIRQSIKNTLISYVGIALGFVSTILLFPRILTPDEYGLTRLLFSIALVCSQFAHLGVRNIIIRFFPYFSHSEASRGRFFSFALAISLVGFILFCILFLLTDELFIHSFRDQSELFTEYYLFLIPLVLAVLFYEVLNNYIRALHDAVTGSLVHEIVLRSSLIVLLVVFYFDFITFPVFMVGFVLCYSLEPILLLAYLWYIGELNIEFPRLKKRTKFLKGIANYGGYALLGGLSTLIVNKIDIIMLGAMLDLESTAVYAIAFYVGNVIAVPQASIAKIAMPVLAGLIKNKEWPGIESLYERTSLNQIIAGVLLYIGIWANMHNLMDILPPEYRGVKWIILTVGFSKLFDMATGINGGIILNSKYYRFDLYTKIFLVIIAVATNYYFIPIYGILGAAIATTISIILYNSIKLFFVWIVFSIQPFRVNSLLIMGLATACLLLSFQLPYLQNFFIDVVIRSAAITIVFIGSILLFNLSDDIKILVQESLLNIQAFFSS